MLGGIGNIYPSISRTNLQLDKKCIVDLAPIRMCFLCEEITKENLVILLSSQPQPKNSKCGEDMVAIHKQEQISSHLQQDYGWHQPFRHDAVHLFGLKTARSGKISFQLHIQDGVD
jgi:hypothetical protein